MWSNLVGHKGYISQDLFELLSRLAALLLHLHEEQGNRIGGYTHQDLAEAVGTYRETITQTLNDFKAKGLIEIGRKRLDILDLAGLEEVAAE